VAKVGGGREGSNPKSNTFSPPSLSSKWIHVMVPLLLIVYLMELTVNRTLYRVLVFIPPEVSMHMAPIVDQFGRFFIALTILIPITLIVAAWNWAFTVVVMALLVLDYIGVARLYLILPILAAYILYKDHKRIIEALLLLVMALYPITGLGMLEYIGNILWILAPIPYISRDKSRNLMASIPISILLLIATFKNPYIMSQVLIFSMNLITPWILPPAIILYSLSSRIELLSILLTGPLLQLSNQVLVISSTYISLLGGGEE